MILMDISLLEIIRELLYDVDIKSLEKIDEESVKNPFNVNITFTELLLRYEEGQENAFTQLFREVEYYRLLPDEIRDFLESDPSNMFILARRLKEAVASREILNKIRELIGSEITKSNNRAENIEL